jgi:NADP-dependent 3-hydroxy acid dehydrogenase YdfG
MPSVVLISGCSSGIGKLTAQTAIGTVQAAREARREREPEWRTLAER